MANHASLWFSLGVGLLVMQVGAYLFPALGTKDALIAIAVGSVIGAGLLGWTARIGCLTGLSSAGLMHAVYGRNMAKLPVLLNILQLLGWTAFELVVMREGTLAIAEKTLGVDPNATGAGLFATLLWGAVLTGLMLSTMLGLVRNFVNRFGLPLVILSLVWLTVHFVGVAQEQGWDSFWNRQGQGGMSTLGAIDLVMAMPVSWLPLVADFARHGRSGGSTLRGTWLGYALANAWCYALGLLVVSTAPADANLLNLLLLAQGGLLALGLILLDELDNAYGDVYSGALSTHSLWSGRSARQWGIVGAVVCTGLAMVLPMHSLEPFLLMLSSVFVPLYGVIIGRLSGVKAGDVPLRDIAIDWRAAALWVAGIACYHLLPRLSPELSAALPTLLLTAVAGWLTRPQAKV
jgi:nucleobase:cation symporter-1, NCS1 family